MSAEIKIAKSKKELEGEQPQTEDVEAETIEEEAPTIIKATEKDEKVQILFELDRRLAKKLEAAIETLDLTKREFIQTAVKNLINSIEDVSIADYILQDDIPANIISRLKEKLPRINGMSVLMPKLYIKIKKHLSGQHGWFEQPNQRWHEFLKALKLEDVDEPKVAYYIAW